MGDDEKITQTDSRSSETQTTEQRERQQEVALNELDLALRQGIQGGLAGSTGAGLGALTAILRGEELPGNLAGIAGGISPEVTQRTVDQALSDVAPQFQSLGLSDSGVRARLGAEMSGDIRAANERFNIQNRLNLLKAGLTGISQVQQPAFLFSQGLGQRLAGLRGTTTQTDRTAAETVTETEKEAFGIDDAIKMAIIAGSVITTGGAATPLIAPEVAAAGLGAFSAGGN
jgi:hypothetical protein